MKTLSVGIVLLIGFVGLVYGVTVFDHWVHTQLGFGWALGLTSVIAIPATVSIFSAS